MMINILFTYEYWNIYSKVMLYGCRCYLVIIFSALDALTRNNNSNPRFFIRVRLVTKCKAFELKRYST